MREREKSKGKRGENNVRRKKKGMMTIKVASTRERKE